MADEIIVPLAFFLCVFGIVFLIINARHKERIALIEKGADASIFQTQRKKYGALKLGLLAIGVAAGIIIGEVLHIHGDVDPEIAGSSMICLFAGIALLASHFIIRKSEKA